MVVWPLSGLLAHCQDCGAASMGSGVLAGVDPQGAQGREEQAQLALPLVVCFGRGPVAPGGRQTRRVDGSTEAQHWVFARCKQVRDGNWFPLGFWLGAWAKEMALVSTFVLHQAELSSGAQQLSLPLSFSPPTL